MLRALRAALLARLERYEDALEAAEQADLPAARISALVGLGRLEEARAAVDAVSDWGGPCWDPYYRAYLAAAEGDVAGAAQRVQEAVAAGFPDRRLIGRTPHLEALRASPHWDPTWALPEA
jgi:hypothetical protein